MIRAASYNIHKGIGLDRRRDPRRILSVLEEIDADIVALQEADRRFFKRRAVITPDLLDVGPGDYRHVRFDMRPLSLGWHGNAILVRNGVDVKRAEPLYLPSFEPRGAVLAELETAHGAVRVIGMHLDLSGLFRIRQLGWLMEMLSVRSPMPTLFMGDTNDWNRGRRAAMPTLPSRFTTAVCGPSFHTRRPTLHLDRIIHDEALHCRASGVHDSDLAKRASDHLPIWADLELRA